MRFCLLYSLNILTWKLLTDHKSHNNTEMRNKVNASLEMMQQLQCSNFVCWVQGIYQS